MQDIPERRRAQYGAVVFNDSVVQRLTASSSNSSSLSIPALDFQSGLALVTAAAAASSLPGGLDQAVMGQLAGQGAALAFTLSKEARVLRKLQARFSGPGYQAVSLMHNASAQHALPSLLSGEQPHRLGADSNPDTTG